MRMNCIFMQLQPSIEDFPEIQRKTGGAKSAGSSSLTSQFFSERAARTASGPLNGPRNPLGPASALSFAPVALSTAKVALEKIAD
jgi:hypothetical protein